MAGYLIGGRFLTGEITLRQVRVPSCDVELTLNAADSIKVGLQIPLTDPATGVSIDIPNQLLPQRDFVAWFENGVVLAGGQIQGDPFSFPRTSTINAAGMWEYFRKRTVLPVLDTEQLPSDVTSSWTGTSLRTIAKRLVEQARSWPSADVPIDLEPDFGGTAEREYPGADLMLVAEALDNLTQVESGPDIAFRPKLMPDLRHVRWDLLTGDPDLSQHGADHYWDVSAPGPHAAITTLDRDGRDLATHAWGIGSTDEETSARLEAKATSAALLDAGFPMMETVVQRNSVLQESTLQAYVDEAVVRYSAFTETFTLRVKRDQNPKLGTYWPGDWARIRVGEGPRVDAGTYRVRIIRIRFSAQGDVTIECSPERVAGGYPVPASDRAWLANQLRTLKGRIDETNRG
ncbi:hypothetical protein ACWGR3_28910 [Streptomyces albidoflavus]